MAISNRTLDRTRAYGEIWGRDSAIPEGARYQQNNLYFDHNGVCLSDESNYKPADTKDLLSDKDAEIARLRAELAKANTPMPAPQAAAAALDREAVIEKLKARNVSFPKTASTEKLYAILQADMDQKAA